MTDQKAAVPAERLTGAMATDVPRIYFNGFACGYSPGDIMCVLERNGEPTAILNMSYTVAKTLSASLTHLVGLLEETSEQPILTTHEVSGFLGQIPPEKSKSESRKTKSRRKKGA